tara:strand:+ start:108 stop:326 length:219 start_codon:yes stop_codon:yes gene_type:complete
MEISDFYSRINDFVDTLKKLPLRPGFDEILVPGDLENKRVKEKLEKGILIDSEVIDSFNILAKDLNIDKLKI